MFVIYNSSGILIGPAGFAAGIAVFMLGRPLLGPSAALGSGLFVIAACWAILSFAWRRSGRSIGEHRPWPALYFIPLPILSLPLLLVSLLFFGAAALEGSKVPDPRAELLMADEAELASFAATGDVELSNSLLAALEAMSVKEAKTDRYHIFTRISDDAVLVLVKAPNLKAYSDNAREELVAMICAELKEHPKTAGKKAFVGIKGKLSYGAMGLPPGEKTLTGRVLDETPLYEFYRRNDAANEAG